MFKNYLKIAWRSIRKHKLFSFINIFGLALSLAVCMVVMIQVKEELSYDLFHPYPDRTFRILTDIADNKAGSRFELASTPLPLLNELILQTGIVQASVQLYPALKEKAATDEKELIINGAFTNSSFFEIFGFKLSAGDLKTALSASDGIVLSSETAARFFGTDNAVGKTLHFKHMGLFRVTGVLEKPAGKSHIDFDAFASSLAIPRLELSGLLPERRGNWNTLNDAYTYVLLKDKVPVDNLDALLKQVALNPGLKSGDGKIIFRSQRLSAITPGSDGIYNDIGKGTVWAKLLTIIGIGLVLLAAACFNYTNLTIARALTRAKEVGIRKVAGARRGQIFSQYIVESVLIALMALAFACLLLAQFKPGFQFTPKLLFTSVLFTILTGSLAGALPAWILSSFSPVYVLKNVLPQKLFGSLSLRKGLMIFQFSLSLLVLIFLSAYYRQFSFLETIDPGFYSKNILTIPVPGKARIFINEVAGISGVEKMSMSSEDFGMRGSGSIPLFLEKPVEGQGVAHNFYFADAGTVPVHRLKIIAGSNFPGNEPSEKEKYILINEKSVRVLNFKDPEAAIGKTVWLNDSTTVSIRGVIKDFYDVGAARQITPLVFRNKEGESNYINIAVNSADREAVVKQVALAWKNLNPQVPFTYEWLDKKIANREDQGDVYVILGFVAFITVTIASLGLLGLVIYTVETRSKEISIRKVIGANVNQLMYLLSKGFLKMLLIAALIAMPVGYIVSIFFLQNFANRVPFGLGTLMINFLFLMGIGLVTILSNTFKVSNANPVKNLRTD